MAATEPDDRSYYLLRMCGMAVIVFSLYVLSPGPVVLFFEKAGWQPGAAIEAFYAPLEAAYENYPWVASFYDSYFQAIGAYP